MTEQAVATVEELPAELRAELVARREAGTTLVELKKGYPQVAPDVIRAVLPPLPKGTEPKPTTRKPRAAKPAQTPTTGQRNAKPSANGQPSKQELALARKVVTMRAKLVNDKPPSWAKIAFALKLVADGASRQQAGNAARRMYKLVKGEDAPTGPSDY